VDIPKSDWHDAIIQRSTNSIGQADYISDWENSQAGIGTTGATIDTGPAQTYLSLSGPRGAHRFWHRHRVQSRLEMDRRTMRDAKCDRGMWHAMPESACAWSAPSALVHVRVGSAMAELTMPGTEIPTDLPSFAAPYIARRSQDMAADGQYLHFR
jgi:hypothetical protein